MYWCDFASSSNGSFKKKQRSCTKCPRRRGAVFRRIYKEQESFLCTEEDLHFEAYAPALALAYELCQIDT